VKTGLRIVVVGAITLVFAAGFIFLGYFLNEAGIYGPYVGNMGFLTEWSVWQLFGMPASVLVALVTYWLTRPRARS